MNIRLLLVIASFVLSIAIGLVIARGGHEGGPVHRDKVLVGLSLDTLKEARWQADRDMFVKRAKELGAEVLVLSANSDDTAQIGDVETLITNKVDVLVIVPHDGKAMAKAVSMAHEAGIPVIAYDRLITRQRPRPVRQLRQRARRRAAGASTWSTHLPTPGKGKIVRIYGSKTDNNAVLFKQGQDNVLEAVHRARRHPGRARGLGRRLEARERQAHHERRDHQGHATSTRCSPATTAPPAARSRRSAKKAWPARCS